MSRRLKWLGSAFVTALFVAYLVWKVDIHKTAHILANAQLGYFFAARK